MATETLKRVDPARKVVRSGKSAPKPQKASTPTQKSPESTPIACSVKPPLAQEVADSKSRASRDADSNKSPPAQEVTRLPKTESPIWLDPALLKLEVSGPTPSAPMKRAVWKRDQGTCVYVDPMTGRKCCSRHRIQFDHVIPYAFGGPTRINNLQLLCQQHNLLKAHRDFGPEKLKKRSGSAGSLLEPDLFFN